MKEFIYKTRTALTLSQTTEVFNEAAKKLDAPNPTQQEIKIAYRFQKKVRPLCDDEMRLIFEKKNGRVMLCAAG